MKSKAPETLTSLEVQGIWTYTLGVVQTNTSSYKDIRNVFMLALILDSGLRVSELAGLEWPDLFLNGSVISTLLVRANIAKRAKERFIPLSERIRFVILSLKSRCEATGMSDPLNHVFCHPRTGRQLTVRQIQRIVSRISLLVIGRAVHPHVLRHTFATRLMRTSNARVVQELLGHTNLSSTQIYTHPNHDDLTKAINSLE